MNIISRVVFRVIVVLISAVGILNLVDAIYAGAATNAAEQSLTMSVNVAETVTVELNTPDSTSPSLSLDVKPNSTGKFVSTSATTPLVSIYTNSPQAFNIGMSMSTTSTQLTSKAGGTIDSIAEDATITTFPVGRWGYSIDGTTYHPIPASNHPDMIYEGSKNSIGQTNVPVVFGVKLDFNTAAGVYNGTLNFAVTAARPGDEIEYIEGTNPPVYAIAPPCGKTPTMQNLNKTLFSTTGTQVQLCDERDGKKYWAAKLADGNIWMTQNLDYDIKATGNEVSKTDGTTATWNANPTYATTNTNWSYDYTIAESYDPGDKYFTTSGSTSNDTQHASLSACTGAGYSQEVCEHGHQGNYYNWYAATAGSNADNMSDGQEATQSICPEGWRLPKGTGSTDSKSWYYMLKNSIANYASNAATSQAMRTAPFYIPRAGSYDGGSPLSVGSLGRYWSSTASGYGDAYRLYFGSSYVYPQNFDLAFNGYSVRCVSL